MAEAHGSATGTLEVTALLSALAMAVGEPAIPRFAAPASSCVLLMVIIPAAWMKTVNSRAPESFPRDWATFRGRWNFLHSVPFVLSAVAFGAAIGGPLV